MLWALLRELSSRQHSSAEGIWIVVDYEYPVPPSEIHDPFIELGSRLGPGRHVRVIGPHDLHPIQVHVLELVEIRMPAVLPLQVVRDELRPGQLCGGCVGGIARVRHEDLLAGIDESQAHQEYSLLGTHERLDAAVRIQGNPVVTRVPVRKSLPEGGDATVVLVDMVAGLPSRLAKGVYRLLRRHAVRGSDPEIDQFLPFLQKLGAYCVKVFLLPGEIVLLNPLGSLSRFYDHGSVCFARRSGAAGCFRSFRIRRARRVPPSAA